MKKVLLFTALFGLYISANAQEYFTGKLVDNLGVTRLINYDRNESAISTYVFQSEYKVLSKGGNLLYTITLTHDQLRSLFSVALKTEGSGIKGALIEYDENGCGLIFSDRGNTDTVFNLSNPYKYLLSFTDVNRDYPVLHKITTAAGDQIMLDPLNKFCLKKHIEIVKSSRVRGYIAQKAQKMEDDNTNNDGNSYRGDLWGDKAANSNKKDGVFTTELLKERDSLYINNTLYNKSITQLREGIEKDIKALLKENHVRDDIKKYGGEKEKGKPDGKGILADQGTIFDGKFEKGEFISGAAVIPADSSEYCGQYSNDYMNGTGVLRYKNGSYLLGKFRNGKLYEGIILTKDKSGEVFFGNCLYNQKTGYGELRSASGNSYYGEFKNGRLIKGYSKEVDEFGYATYSKIDNDTKKPIDPQLAKDFFAEALSKK